MRVKATSNPALAQLRSNRRVRRDPTQTTVLRRKYAIAHRKRFRAISALIHETIVDNDAFLLERDLSVFQATPLPLPLPDPTAAQPFEFTRTADKINAFMRWLRQATDLEILEIIEREGRQVVERRAWQDLYIRQGYARGVAQADAKLRATGLQIDTPSTPRWIEQNVLSMPRHADALGILYTRNFQELEGITAAMDQAISRELTAGFSQGLGPRQIARQLADRVDKIGIHRANLLARTEIVNAHAESTLNRFEDFGVEQVAGFAEFATAGDNRVCQRCRDIESGDAFGLGPGIYPIQRARGLIPVHPQCRCSWWPIVEPLQ